MALFFQGRIFNIQRYSLHDGEGIRTTIFFMGCHLRCSWCANPEGQRQYPFLYYQKSKCIDCRSCIVPYELHFDEKGPYATGHPPIWKKPPQTYADRCPTGALSVMGSMPIVDEVMEIIRKDKPFYEASGGGVTLSGGEPMLQSTFAAGILQACKEEGINTAVETSGHCYYEDIEKVYPYADRIYFDIKHTDPLKHRAWTGVTNQAILSNLHKLIRVHNDVVIRITLIPGFNTDDDELRRLALFLRDLKLPYELQRFHQLGKAKYEACRKPYYMRDVPAMTEEEYQGYCEKFKSYYDSKD